MVFVCEIAFKKIFFQYFCLQYLKDDKTMLYRFYLNYMHHDILYYFFDAFRFFFFISFNSSYYFVYFLITSEIIPGDGDSAGIQSVRCPGATWTLSVLSDGTYPISRQWMQEGRGITSGNTCDTYFSFMHLIPRYISIDR